MKRHDPLIRWLRLKALRWQLIYAGVGLLTLAVGVLFCAGTFAVAYVLVTLTCSHWIHNHILRLCLAGFVLELIALFDLLHPRPWCEELHIARAGAKPITIYVPGLDPVLRINLVAGLTLHAILAPFWQMLGAGPRTVRRALLVYADAVNLFQVDLRGCAAIVKFLAKKGQKVAYDEIAEHVPPGHDLANILTGLRMLDVVLFLQAEPAGLKLTRECQVAIAALYSRRPKKGPESSGHLREPITTPI